MVRSARVVLPDREHPAAIQIDDGVIKRVASYEDVPPGAELVDVGELVVSPGLVDTHVHVNEPGRTQWEGFDTATRAAAAGGVTTIVDMPLNSVPATTTAAALDAKREAARGRCHVDVAFWGGVVPRNASELGRLVECGVRGFKCFLVPSGVDEFLPVEESDLRAAMPLLARLRVPLLVHAEIFGPNSELSIPNSKFSIPNSEFSIPNSEPSIPNSYSYKSYLATRPPEAEVAAIRLMTRLARDFGVHTHIVHVACAEGVEEIARGKADGVPITAETCPHYLTFDADEIPGGATEFKCAPPIRDARHREALWRGLTGGILDLVATDHSPAPSSMKCPGDFLRAWGGIASLELSLAAVWTASARVRASTRDLARWMSESPARLAGLGERKGRIAPGCDADLVVWDPEAETTVDSERLQQRHKTTPYAGRRLRGVVRTTLLRGRRVWDGEALANARMGRLL